MQWAVVLVVAIGVSTSASARDGKRKVFVGGIYTETHTASPILTRRADFVDNQVAKQIYREAAQKRGWALEFGLTVTAPPAGRVLKPAYEEMRAQLLSDLKRAMPVDMVVLDLHGAMMVQGMVKNVEGDLLGAVRQIVGPSVPIGAGMDTHAHLSSEMLANADILLFYKEWPHIDAAQTRSHAFELTADVAEGKIKPHMAVYDVGMVARYHTLMEPVRSLISDLKAAERQPGVIATNLVHGFVNGDSPDVGSKILILTNHEPKKGAALAKSFGERVYALRGKTAPEPTDLEPGIAAVLASRGRPSIIADHSDCMNCGAPGDATFLLRAMLDAGLDDFIIAGLWDPFAISMLDGRSQGDKLKLRIGGKTGPTSGDPIDLDVELRSMARGMTFAENRMVPTAAGAKEGTDVAVVRYKNSDIVLVSRRTVILHHGILEDLGLNPSQRRAIVVKSANPSYSRA